MTLFELHKIFEENFRPADHTTRRFVVVEFKSSDLEQIVEELKTEFNIDKKAAETCFLYGRKIHWQSHITWENQNIYDIIMTFGDLGIIGHDTDDRDDYEDSFDRVYCDPRFKDIDVVDIIESDDSRGIEICLKSTPEFVKLFKERIIKEEHLTN